MSLTRTALLFAAAAASSWAATEAPKMEAIAQVPLAFEVNQGQTAPQVRYVAHGLGCTSYLTGSEAVLAFSGSPAAVLRMKLAGASSAEPAGMQQMAGKSNYIIGNDPKKWRTGIPSFAKVQYKEVYPGIDLVYHGNQRQLEYDFVVAPGADPSAIRLEFAGARAMRIDADGDLVLRVAGQDVRFHKPVAYQATADGARREVAGRYLSRGSSGIAFEVGEYDKNQTLVIDPVLLQATFLGGAGTDIGYGITSDGAGFTYVTGSTASANFPLHACSQCVPGGGKSDAFVTAYLPGGGGILYSTFLGGPGTDIGRAIRTPYHAPGGPSPVVVVGSTTGGFPLLAPVQPLYGGGPSDAFVTALGPAGFPIYSTYLGGKGADVAYGVAVDAGMNAYITGSTDSVNFPAKHHNCLQCVLLGKTNAFVTELPPPGGPILYSTYLGGAGDDIAYGISTDNLGDVGITGSTTSPNFPVIACPQCALVGPAGVMNAFVSFLSPNAGGGPVPVLSWSTYWGGPGNDAGRGIHIDNVGVGWITGWSDPGFPLVACQQCVYGGGASDAIVAEFQVGPIFSDYFGGAGADIGYAISQTNQGTVFITGSTDSAAVTFPPPGLPGCFQCVLGGGTDAFVAEYAPGGVRIFGSFLGGGANDVGYAIVSNFFTGLTFVTGSTGKPVPPNFPTPGCGPLQCVYGGGASDAFVATIH